MQERKGTVTALGDGMATVVLEDGTVRFVDVPEMIDVRVGSPVTIVDVGDGKPIFSWGSPPGAA